MFLAHWKRAILAHPGPLLALFLGVLVPLWVFGALAEDVWTHAGFRWDAPILLAIHAHATPALDRLMIAVSTVGGPGGMAVLCVLVVAILLRRRRRRAALFVALAYGGAVLLNALDKAVFRSARPHLWTSPAPASGYGFPSGHADGLDGTAGRAGLPRLAQAPALAGSHSRGRHRRLDWLLAPLPRRALPERRGGGLGGGARLGRRSAPDPGQPRRTSRTTAPLSPSARRHPPSRSAEGIGEMIGVILNPHAGYVGTSVPG